MKLSIITINYNNKEGLRKTIDSVITQTFEDYEWIIIDGGSIDGSKELIEQYQQHFAYWCSELDKGVYNAMNKGIEHARGEYLLFLNSGDALYDMNVLQKVYDIHSNADIISGQVIRMDNNKLLRQYRSSLLLQLYLDTLNHQGTFIRKSLFNDNLYDENLKIVSDWKFWLDSIIRKNASVDVIDVVVARQDMSGISSDSDKEHVERQMVLKEFVPLFYQKGFEEYLTMCASPYCILSENLQKKSHLLYSVGCRFLILLNKFV
jgi:glycosyltransferase involved in cell wall biosynthesis